MYVIEALRSVLPRTGSASLAMLRAPGVSRRPVLVSGAGTGVRRACGDVDAPSTSTAARARRSWFYSPAGVAVLATPVTVSDTTIREKIVGVPERGSADETTAIR
jgi:hypothetical protein